MLKKNCNIAYSNALKTMSSTKNGIKIGNKIRKLRMAKNYTQEYMAEVLEVSPKTYSNMENDKSTISLETLHKLAQELEVDVLELVSDSKIVIQNNTATENSSHNFNGIVVNHLSDELLTQFKERIDDLKKLLEEKENQIAFLKDQLTFRPN